MSKKKLKKTLKKMAAVPTASLKQAVTGVHDAHNAAMWDSSSLVYQIFRINNGYNVICHIRAFDNMGRRTNDVTQVHFVNKLTDIPTVMASTGASQVMGL